MTGDPLVEHDQLVSDLRGALYEGQSGLNYVPRLLHRLLETEAWRERYDAKTHQVVRFNSFTEFVKTPPTEGLGASMDLVDRIVGHDDAELLRLLKAAKAVGQGTRTDLLPCESQESDEGYDGGTDYFADRLARDAPDEYEAVQSGEKTIHRAAVDAGIRKRRVSVRLDSAESTARTLRKHMSADDLAQLARLLTEEV